MKALQRRILEQVIDGMTEPVVVAKTSSADWPIAYCNAPFAARAADIEVRGRPFADVLEDMFGRTAALEVSEAVRARRAATIPVENSKREFMLALNPLEASGGAGCDYVAAYLRDAASTAAAGTDVQQALINAKRRIRDLSREDPVTGLLNARAFRDVLDHDWSVARREKATLALVAFSLDDFDKYVEVFGRHASDSCQRRVAGAIRRCLRRASDVAARIEGADGDRLVVLAHSADEARLTEFAERILASVRDLGLHHPRARSGRFVTVSYRVVVGDTAAGKLNAGQVLEQILS